MEKDVFKVMELSERIQSIINDREEMPNGDYQGCIEAVIMNAIQYGKEAAK